MGASSLSSAVAKSVTAASSAVTATSTLRATPQGGILEGANPANYDPKNPIFMFIIQAGIIIIFCRLLHYPLSMLRQPRVIAEVIGGIILGPSVMMRIPGFKEAIFPAASMAGLSLVANLGLILFLFLVGLEVNMRMFLSNWRVALSVGLAGMALPFGLGCGIAYGLYHAFHDEPGLKPISFGVYMLFIATALSITAFPVLCRILTELKLLSTPVGVTVLAAGVGNDVIGWILLALCVALVNNGSGISALYVLLTGIAWILFLVFAVRPAFFWLLRRSGSIRNGPSQGIMALTLILVLASSWFTGIIGIHPIFGAFLVGLICPHEGGFPIHVAEKIEDLISVVFLPLYFALSGLSTNLGLLDSGKAWAYVVGVIAIAFSGKIIGGTLAARANKLLWRESVTIGVLMSCKGLVELIVLNIGLQAKILSTRTFTIFVVMALVTTVTTTPAVSFLYPPTYQRKLEAFRRGEIDWDGNHLDQDQDSGSSPGDLEKLQATKVQSLLVYLRLDGLPSLFTFIALLGGERSAVKTKIHASKRTELATVSELEGGVAADGRLAPPKLLEVHGLRILELTERTSSVMQGTEIEEDSHTDPVVNAFKTFAQLNNVAVSGGVSVVPEASYAETLTSQAADHFSDLILIPWTKLDTPSVREPTGDSLSSSLQDAFIHKVLGTATCNTAIFVNHGFGGLPSSEEQPVLSRSVSAMSVRSHGTRRPVLTLPIWDRTHHVYFPFFGGVDDRVACRFVLQLAENTNITATIVHFTLPLQQGQKSRLFEATSTPSHLTSSPVEITETVNTETLHATAARDTAFLHTLRDSLPSSLAGRVVFREQATTQPIADCLAQARREVGQNQQNAGDLVVVGRARHTSIDRASEYSSPPANTEMRRSLGVTAEAILSGGVRASVLVMQAGGRNLDV